MYDLETDEDVGIFARDVPPPPPPEEPVTSRFAAGWWIMVSLIIGGAMWVGLAVLIF